MLRRPNGRLATGPVVLAGQDTTAVDGIAHPAPMGLGPMGHAACPGLLVHSTLARAPARIPLGLGTPQGWARAPAAIGQRARRTPLPISQKARQTWLPRLAAVVSAHAEGPQTRLGRMGDWAAEGYALLVAPRPMGVARLSRASWDRWGSMPQRWLSR